MELPTLLRRHWFWLTFVAACLAAWLWFPTTWVLEQGKAFVEARAKAHEAHALASQTANLPEVDRVEVLVLDRSKNRAQVARRHGCPRAIGPVQSTR